MVGTRSRYSAPADDDNNLTDIPADCSGDIELDDVEQETIVIPNPTPTSTESQSSSFPPFTPTPTPSERALFLKRKRSTAKTGRWQKDEHMWKYSRARLAHEEERNDHGQRLFYCEFCSWCNISSNAAGHLKTHGILAGRAIAQPAEVLQHQSIEKGLQNMASKKETDDAVRASIIMKNAVDKQQFRNAVTRFVTTCSLSHLSVTSEAFKDMILAANPEAKHALIKAATTLRPRIKRMFEEQQLIVIHWLARSLSCFHISTDTWKTSHGHKHFQAVNCQFVDQHGVLRQVLLDLIEVDGEQRKTGAYLASLLIKTCQEYSLLHRLGWITSDNVTVNDTLVRSIEVHMRNFGITDWTEKTRRLRCIGHIINLATQAFMFANDTEAAEIAYARAELSQLDNQLDNESLVSMEATENGLVRQPALQKLKALAIALRDDRFWQAFKSLARSFPELPSTVPKIPGETRWNGWLLMIEEAFQTRPILDALFARYHDSLELMSLSDEDWRLLEHIANFLMPFKEVTKMNEGHNTTLDNFQPSMEFLISHFEKQQVLHTRREVMLRPINTAWLLFEKYYSLIDQSGAYITALLLHPERRVKWLRKRWTTPQKKKWLSAGLKRANDLWLEYAQRLQPSTVNTPMNAAPLSEFEKWQQDQDVVPDEDDFTAFINAQPCKLPIVDGKQLSVIEWWASPLQRQSYLALSQLAIDVLSALAMSAESERTFSSARRTTSWERSQLDGNTIRHSELSKDWQRKGLADMKIDSNGMDSEEDDN
jgi:hypothetical protein